MTFDEQLKLAQEHAKAITEPLDLDEIFKLMRVIIERRKRDREGGWIDTPE